jgi:hypothetical protein
LGRPVLCPVHHARFSSLERSDCRQMAAVAPSEFAKQHWLETTAHWMKMAAAEEGAMGTTRPGQFGSFAGTPPQQY